MQKIRCPHCQQEFAGEVGEGAPCPLCGEALPPEAFLGDPPSAEAAGAQAFAGPVAGGSGRKWLLLAGAAAVVLAAAGGLWYFLSGRDDPGAAQRSRHILSARRTREATFTVTNPWNRNLGNEVSCMRETDVLLVLAFREIPEDLVDERGAVRRETCRLIVDGEVRPGLRVLTLNADAGPKARRYVGIVTVPKDVRDMTLHVEGLGAIHFEAEEEVHESLEIGEE